MPDYHAIPNDRLKQAQQLHGRAVALEKVAKAEAESWRRKYETGIHFSSKEELAAVLEQCPTYKRVLDERDRYRRAFVAVFAVNVAAFVGSVLWAMGRVL